MLEYIKGETKMKFVIQRVKNASVEVDKKVVGKINQGFLSKK